MEPLYWKPEPRRYPPYLRRWITRGRGIGRGSAYRPWLTVRDVPSRGTSFKIAGIKIKRVFQVFSEQEATYLFLSERNPKVVDIRENWPILDIDWTLQACKAVSGMGKTTFISSFLLGYPQIIRHTQYHGRKLKCHQIVYLVLRVPHDATLKSLCLQFFDKVDHLLGTNYLRQARGLRQIAPMVHLMNQVATATSLGFIVIDDIQNLRSAKGGTLK